jgi:hypothetical protein
MKINGLELPSALDKAIESGAWKMPKDPELVQRVFPLERLVQPVLYDKYSLAFENADWPNETKSSYVGAKGGRELPGDIDTSKSAIIGDLGPDLPIALDYRHSAERPSVVYLFQDGPWTVRWATAAPDIESLIFALRLGR